MECTRSAVSADGQLNFGGFAGGFAGGVGGGFGGGTATPLHLEAEPITLALVAPLTSCPGDDLRVTVEVLAPDSSGVPNVSTPLTSSNAIVSTSVTFTPPGPGLYVVRAAFEPSIGVRTTTVTVIGSYDEASAMRVELPAGVTCSKTPWPVARDTLACESAGNQISLFSADGGVERFNGGALAVVNDVLWSETSTQTLERREWSADAGLSLTRSVPGFSTSRIRGMHTRTTALRKRANDLVGLVLPDGGLSEAFFNTTDFEAGVFFTESDLEAHVAGSFTCGNCLNSLVAIDDGFAWQQLSGGQLNGYRRPITVSTPFITPTLVLQLNARPTFLPNEPLERWPLWVDPPERPTVSILIRAHHGALDWSAWPRGRVVRVGPSEVVLNDGTDAGTAFFIAPLER